MDGLNRWQGLGNLGADPELRITSSGSSVLKLRMAITTSWFDKEKNVREERTEWVNVTIFGKRGEGLAKYLHKGSKVLVEGELRTSSYEKEGVKHYRTEIVASEIWMLDGKPQAQQGASGGPGWGQGQPAQAQPPAQPEQGQSGGPEGYPKSWG